VEDRSEFAVLSEPIEAPFGPSQKQGEEGLPRHGPEKTLALPNSQIDVPRCAEECHRVVSEKGRELREEQV
jgi:hypothetical protein